jgi:hypothetical protein
MRTVGAGAAQWKRAKIAPIPSNDHTIRQRRDFPLLVRCPGGVKRLQIIFNYAYS